MARPSTHIQPFRVMTVMERATQLEAEGRTVIHMEVGEPDFDTAAPIVAAGKAALDAGLTHYTPAPGIPELRDQLAAHYQDTYGVRISRERILVTPAASGGLGLLANLLLAPGDGVLLADPAYPCVRNFVRLMSAEPQLIPVNLKQNFQPSQDQLVSYRKENTCGVWLASPGNPTGTILNRDQLQAAADWTHQEGLHLLVDEIYHGLHYVDDLPSALEVDSDCYIVNSFSKYFGMTGWRLGWIVVPESAQETANILAQNLYISASSVAQHAALAAFHKDTREILEQRRQSFRQRRDFLTQALAELGFQFADEIPGAFYIYADISKFADDSEQFCQHMLEQHGVAITPGSDFGDYCSERYVRFAFTTTMENLEAGVERLQHAL